MFGKWIEVAQMNAVYVASKVQRSHSLSCSVFMMQPIFLHHEAFPNISQTIGTTEFSVRGKDFVRFIGVCQVPGSADFAQ